MLASSAGGVFGKIIPRTSASRCIVSRGSISTAAAAPDDHDAPAFCENGQILPEIHVREHFHDHVNAVPAGRLHDLLKMIRRAMIEHFVRALFARELESFITARRAEHAQTASTRQLHRRRPDTAARAVHQHRFARLGVGALQQPAIRRRVRRPHGRALRERNICRQRMHLLLFAQRELRIRSARSIPRYKHDRRL